MRALATIAAVALAAGCVQPPPREPPREAPKDALASVAALAQVGIAKGEFPSAAFAVVGADGTIRAGAVGWADREGAVSSTPATPYPLASVTKPIAATALMVLAERGAIDLDKPALGYLGRKPAAGQDYTVRQLLSHTAGLGTYARIYWQDQPIEIRPLMESFSTYGFAAQPPGTVFEYSNLGYGLLGEIIAARSGTTLEKFLQGEVFEPLGMRDSQLVNGCAAPPGAAQKYAAELRRLADTCNDTPAAGNVYASARDLARFAAFSLGGQLDGARPILDLATLGAMQSPAEPQALHPYYGGAGYGLGWYVEDSGGERVVWHEGGMPGASSILVLLPQRRIAAVVLINASEVNARAQDLANELLRVAAPDVPPIAFVATDGFDRFGGQPGWAGRWSGDIEIDGQRRPWTLELEPAGAVRATFPGEAEPQVAYVTHVSGPLLLGTFPGRLPARDVDQQREGGFVLLRLMLRGDRLVGMAVAYSAEERLEHLYPFRAQLVRQP